MQFQMLKVLEKRYRVVVSFGPTAADEKVIHVRAAGTDLAYHKAEEYCKHHNIKNPSFVITEAQ